MDKLWTLLLSARDSLLSSMLWTLSAPSRYSKLPLWKPYWLVRGYWARKCLKLKNYRLGSAVDPHIRIVLRSRVLRNSLTARNNMLIEHWCFYCPYFHFVKTRFVFQESPRFCHGLEAFRSWLKWRYHRFNKKVSLAFPGLDLTPQVPDFQVMS